MSGHLLEASICKVGFALAPSELFSCKSCAGPLHAALCLRKPGFVCRSSSAKVTRFEGFVFTSAAEYDCHAEPESEKAAQDTHFV